MRSDVDALFKVPLREFTSARNALVARLKKAGQPAEAAESKALPKPSVSAWVVNQLYWRHGYLFGRLLESGERLRDAQTSRQMGNTARELIDARREVVATLATLATDILREDGYSDTRDLMRRVTSTLEALSAYGSLSGGASAGRLTCDLEPPGFETLAALPPRKGAIGQPASESRPSVRRPEAKDAKKSVGRVAKPDTAAHRREERRLVTAARSAMRKADRELSAARQQAERAQARLETAVARAKTSEAQRAELEKQLARVGKEAEAAREQARATEADVLEATRAAEGAERALQLARARLEQLAGKQD